MKTQHTVIHSLAALIAFASVSQVARAAEPTPPGPVANSTVSFADLNLAAPQGADRLYHRIAAAAQHVCGADEHPRAVADQARVQMCVERSIERAVAVVNQPALTALLAAKTGRPAAPVVLANRR